jgi:arylsulfatase A-like enzyme
MRGGLFLVALVALSACHRDTKPPHVTTEEVVAEVAPPLAADAVVEQATAGAVRVEALQPEVERPGVVAREALVAAPPATVTMRLAVPPDAVLRFSIGVDGDDKHDDRSGIEFGVRVDGRQRFHQTLNPAARKAHRDWHDGLVDLGDERDRTVEVSFETRAEDPALPTSGTPGWSHVRLVRRTTRDRQPASRQAPNLLVLLVDTLRADRLGVYGARPSTSPALDRLAATGVVFDDAISQSSWTLPSVSSLLTGLHPRSHGVGAHVPTTADGVGGGGFMPDQLVTWPELAHRAGITTAGFSANPLVGPDTNLSQGFETFETFAWDPKTDDWHPASEINQRFLDWVGANRAWRFVAWLQYMEPHDPYNPPAQLRPRVTPPGLAPAIVSGRISRRAKRITSGQAPPFSPQEIEYLLQLYDGDIRAWDDALATLLRGLESAGVLDSTIIIVTADHGEEFQEHGRLKHGTHLYEETIRVPLVIAGPGIPAGHRTDVAQGIDLFPTITAMLGLTPDAPPAGRDLLVTRKGRDVISETSLGVLPGGAPTDLLSLRTPDWKLIRTRGVDAIELYDLKNDPGEHASDPAASTAATLGQALDRWAASAPAAPHTTGADPTLRAKLRALGYAD